MGRESNIYFDFQKILVCSVILFVVVVGCTALWVYKEKFGLPWPIDSLGKIGDFGAFGDFVGGLMNPLLQFIVISMLFWSIQVQRQELKATRDTLSATKDELTATKEANESQANSLNDQVNLFRAKNKIEDAIKGLADIDNRLEVLLNFEIPKKNTSIPIDQSYTLKQILWGTSPRGFGARALEDIVKKNDPEV